MTQTTTKPRADSATNGSGPPPAPELREIPIDAIDPGPNVRSADALDVQELATSIRSAGVLSPIRVEEAGARDGSPRYALVYGQRRVAAAKAAGRTTIPALVDEANRTGTALVVAQLIENLQREDLNALDAARAYRQILDAGMTQRQLAAELGIAQPTIANTLALLKAPDEIQAKVAAGELTRSHVEAIVKLPKAEQAEVARRVVEHKLSTRDLERELDMAANRQSAEDRRRDAQANRDKELLAGWIALLLKKKADPATTTLVGWAGIPADGLAALAKQGWKRSQTAARGADQAWRAPAPKGFCDCDAYELSYSIDWRAGGETYKPTITKACIAKAHQTAADKAQREAIEAQQREQREAEQKAREEHEAAIAPATTALTTPIPPTKAKLILMSLIAGERHGNGWWNASPWLERVTGKTPSYDGWMVALWKAIDGLDHERLLAEIARAVAERIVDAGPDPAREALESLYGAAERVAAKKAKAKS